VDHKELQPIAIFDRMKPEVSMTILRKRKVLRELRSQYQGMLRLRCDTPEAYRITDELRLQILELEFYT
jgi:hypothetical protein